MKTAEILEKELDIIFLEAKSKVLSAYIETLTKLEEELAEIQKKNWTAEDIQRNEG